MTWMPPGGRHGYDMGVSEEAPLGRFAPTVCPGYSCTLPEVFEAARARLHWDKGQLQAFTGEPPTERLVELIEMLDSQYNAVQYWKMTPTSEGGGMEGR